MKDVIVIPTYNERDNIPLLLEEVFKILPNVHVLVVDDSSPDRTADVTKELMKKYPNLLLYVRGAKEGLGAAYKDALQKVLQNKDVRKVVTMDADGSHDPSYLPLLLRESEKYDLVIGSRYVSGGGVEQWEKWRYALSKYGNRYARFFSGIPVNDLTAGFNCARRDILEKIDFDEIGSSGYAYQIEFKSHCFYKNATIKEIPIIFRTRREGESKMSSHIIREGLITPLRLFLKRFVK